MAIGALVGAAAGLGIGAGAASVCPIDGYAQPCTQGAVTSMASGILLGGLAGAFIGSGRSHWQRLLPRYGTGTAAPTGTEAVLTVTDDAGQRSTPTHQVSITSGNPTVSFTSTVVTAATHTMLFDGGGTTASGTATIASYQWSFGDSTTGTGQTITHSYAASGSYPVRLTVTDSLGRIGTTSASVTVP